MPWDAPTSYRASYSRSHEPHNYISMDWRKGKDMKMLNLQYRIVAAESELLPDHGFICLVYAPKADMIVLNDDCSSLDQVVELIANYLALDIKEREQFRSQPNYSKLRGLMRALDQVAEIRSRKKTA